MFFTTAVVAIHTIILTAHSAAHMVLGITMSAVHNVYIAVVIIAGPLVGYGLLWTKRRRLGAAILLAAMLGSFAFGFHYHFVELSPDHVSRIPEGPWGRVFVASAYGLAIAELAGVLAAIGLFRSFGQATPPG